MSRGYGNPGRSSRPDVRNPVQALPAAGHLVELPPEALVVLAAVLEGIREDAAERAEACWRRHKAPMAAYWKAVAVYARHIRRALPSSLAMPLCPYCSLEQEIDLHEVWDGREFMVRTCCEQSEEEVRWGLAHDPDWARTLLQHLGIETICGERLRRVADDGLGALILDWQLRLDRIAFRDARRFIDQHHEHLPAPTGWRYGQGIWNGPDLLGVVTVGQPLARAFDPQQAVEVTRLCVRRDRPDALRWNACSQLYGWAAREAQLRGFRRIITYTRQDEAGATLRAVGWRCDSPAGGAAGTGAVASGSIAPPCQGSAGHANSPPRGRYP